jgi:hypothetical protein
MPPALPAEPSGLPIVYNPAGLPENGDWPDEREFGPRGVQAPSERAAQESQISVTTP